MKRFLFACVLAAFPALFLSAPAAAFRKEAGITKDCSECHKLTKEEAGKTLGKIVDNVVGVVQGPFPGIWEVDVARDGKTYPLYLDYSLKYLFTGQFIRLAGMENLVMPYPRNPNDKATYRKCQAVVCAKSEKMLDDAFAGKEVPAPTCKTDAVDETIQLAERLKVQGTPTMILPDGRMVSGSMEADALLALLK
jgi:protein-disulfide isomerase